MFKFIKSKPINDNDLQRTVEKRPVNDMGLQNISSGVKASEYEQIKSKKPIPGPYFPDVYEPCYCKYCGRRFTNSARRDYHIACEHPNDKKDGKTNTSTDDKFLI